MLKKQSPKEVLENLEEGDLLLTKDLIKNKLSLDNLLYILSPSPLKHVSVYYGKNLKNNLIRIKNNILNNDEEAVFLSKHNIFIKDILLKNIDSYISSTNNYDEYIIEIQISEFKIIKFNEYQKLKSEIYVYRIDNVHKKVFKNFYLYFIGNKYSIFYEIGKRYCFESIVSLLTVLYEDFEIIYLKNLKYKHWIFFNSISITKNSRIKLKKIILQM